MNIKQKRRQASKNKNNIELIIYFLVKSLGIYDLTTIT
jgi:hypothetical protein